MRLLRSLVKVSENLATSVLATGLLVVHDAVGGGQDDEAELTRRKQVVDPVLHLGQFDVVAGRDDTTLVQAAIQLNDNLSSTMVIDDFKFTNIT